MKQIYIFYFILAAGHCFNQQAFWSRAALLSGPQAPARLSLLTCCSSDVGHLVEHKGQITTKELN